jgi:3-oxoacyl-[acyl-carrier-protein] synthase III
MGACIESVAARRARGGPLAPDALRLSDAAARACLEEAGRRPEELDLLINAGLYKHKNMAEPALASIIQEDIGANPGHPPSHDRHGTFSFDVMNGGCGVLSGLYLVDSFVGPGAAQLGMVVAADADPAPRTSRGFHFPPVGGAILLRHSGDGEGFTRFEFHTFPEHSGLFESWVEFEPASGGGLFGHRGYSRLDVHEDPRYPAVCVERATGVTRAFLDRARLRLEQVDLLIASAYPPRFAAELAHGLGIVGDRLPELPPELAGAHTAGPIAALAAATDTGRFGQARNTLFVTVGAGITVAVALYHH